VGRNNVDSIDDTQLIKKLAALYVDKVAEVETQASIMRYYTSKISELEKELASLKVSRTTND